MNIQKLFCDSFIWWSIQFFKDSHELDGVMEVEMAVGLSLPDTENQLLLNRYLEIALGIYLDYQLQNPTGD